MNFLEKKLYKYICVGEGAVPAVDPLGPQDVPPRRENHPQVHTHTEQDEGDRHKGGQRLS